jgi:16S rRNA (cytosine967-C5)-methyltransferase
MSRASQLVGLCVGRGGRILDACAAPGGKTAMLVGEVTAVELNPGRARELTDNLRRLGRSDVRVVVGDARELDDGAFDHGAFDDRAFDHALVDAPCSGLGVLAQRPDLRWRSRPLPELQLELLRAAAARVKPGGTIVYSVCTNNRDENEAVVDAAGFELDRLGDEWPAFAHPRRPEFLLTLPHVHGTSGFFVARLRAS